MVLLNTSELNGCVFIRTDQLDGETDWKLRHSVKADRVYEMLIVEPPKLDIYDFKGVIKSEAHLLFSSQKRFSTLPPLVIYRISYPTRV